MVVSSRDSTWNDMAAVERLRQHRQGLPLILATEQTSETRVIAALRAGVQDYLRLPCTDEELVTSLRRCLAWQGNDWGQQNRPWVPEKLANSRLVGETPAMRKIKEYLGKVARTDSNVLITGETGTGKELAALEIHEASARREKRLVTINCAAVPDSLLEGELFGYEKGAFTGAQSPFAGRLRHAEGGTVFFDEIGEMSPMAQAKILRALETKEVYRLGGSKCIPLDFRVVAATNRDLEQTVHAGQFRRDLYFRLNVARVRLPPLRKRVEDIPLLVGRHIQELNARLGMEVEGAAEEVMRALTEHRWPGNVRELRNVMEAAFVNRPGPWVRLHHLPDALQRPLIKPANRPRTLGEERDALFDALKATNWNKSEAAKKLNCSRMTLYRKMRKHQIAADASA
jgi:DNA-binding NtrC family response regulator